MVQLKVISVVRIPVFHIDFNSSMVQLKEFCIDYDTAKLPDFNSSMVQLKVSNPNSNSLNSEIFQFQYGSIKRLSNSILL